MTGNVRTKKSSKWSSTIFSVVRDILVDISVKFTIKMITIYIEMNNQSKRNAINRLQRLE